MIDLEIVKFLNHWGSPWIDSLTELVSSNFLLIILAVLITAYFLIFDKKDGTKIALAISIAIVLHLLISDVFFKHILPEFGFFRLRPYLAYPEEIVPLGQLNRDSSFPSSHMASVIAVLAVYVYYYRRLWPVAVIFAIFIAFARMHNGMHYPTDVVAGSIFGVIYGMAAIYIVNKKN